MYDIEKKQYILKLATGKIINIFYKEGSGIYISSLSKKNYWLEAIPLARDTSPYFSVDLDAQDNVYILFQDKHGNILRGRYNSENVSIKPVLNSKNPTSYNKHLHVICSGDKIYYFYTLEYSGNKLLSYQVQNGSGNLSTPKVIDYVSESVIPYRVVQDFKKDIYIFYKSNDTKAPAIGYKKYNPESDSWSDFENAVSVPSESSIIDVIMDSENNIYISWQKGNPQKYELLCSLKPSASDSWLPESTIASQQYNFYNSSLFVVNGLLACFWIRGNSIYYSSRTNVGTLWSKEEKYSFYENKPFYCTVYKSNTKENTRETIYNELPANFLGGYRIAFINDSNLKPGTPNQDEVRTILSDTLKSLGKNLDEVKQLVSDLKNRLCSKIVLKIYKLLREAILTSLNSSLKNIEK